jgi:hypothetical protein
METDEPSVLATTKSIRDLHCDLPSIINANGRLPHDDSIAPQRSRHHPAAALALGTCM